MAEITINPQESAPYSWDGFRETLSRLFGRKIERGTPPIEFLLNDTIASKRAQVRISDCDVDSFCVVTHDNNPIHRSAYIAKEILCLPEEKKVVPGVQLAALGEEYINEALVVINDRWNLDLKFVGSNIRFKKWIHPGDNVYWQVIKHRELDQGADLIIEGRIGKRSGPLGIGLVAYLRRSMPIPKPSIEGDPLFRWTDEYTFNRKELDWFYTSVGEPPREQIPWTYPIALIVASMLKKTLGPNGIPEGINRDMEFNYHKTHYLSNPGDSSSVKIDFYEARPIRDMTRRGLGFGYTLDALCIQNGEPLVSGRIQATTKRKIEY
ncbi:MAG: hypothetical protein AAB414_03735 [Patescibacteria group bacterium]